MTFHIISIMLNDLYLTIILYPAWISLSILIGFFLSILLSLNLLVMKLYNDNLLLLLLGF